MLFTMICLVMIISDRNMLLLGSPFGKAGIECTWYLMAALIQDRELQQDVNEQQLCLSYAMAIVRFVNHLTEKGQNKTYVQAVHVLAEELGLPLWLVEMRHDATHASLPSLSLLRCATQYALAWIKREYWDATVYDDSSDEEGAAPSPQANLKMNEKQLSDKLIEFMQEQFSRTSELGDERRVKSITTDLKKFISKCREKFVSLLASEGYLILTELQLQALNIDVKYLTTSSKLVLPKVIVSFWQPVISLCQSMGLLPQILMHLGQDLSDKNTLYDRLRAGWITTIIRALSKPGVENAIPITRQRIILESPVFDAPYTIIPPPPDLTMGIVPRGSRDTGLHLKNTAAEIDGLRLLRICLHSPNIYTCKLITSQLPANTGHTSVTSMPTNRLYGLVGSYQYSVKIMDKYSVMSPLYSLFTDLDIPLSNKQKDELVELLQCCSDGGSCGQTQTSDKSFDSIYTVDSLLKASDVENSCETSPEDGTWQFAGGLVDWASYPIGSCPHGPLTYNGLELEESVNKLLCTTEQHSERNLKSCDSEITGEESGESDVCEEVDMDVVDDLDTDSRSQLSVAEIMKNVSLFN
ncbi:hypothetical protein LSH36_272g06061 [Paralvinella palmiformis]|uniref:Uncharacterized protein n=1 Tax=Paralvinella palmiformis TaxID=53620 RepID=A0AAD9JKU2_9ANNE|nr:hypothetical protein LSH36_272g06061 [Paralvinella palmiformis]